MTIDLDEREFHISNPNSLWAGKSLYKLYGEGYGYGETLQAGGVDSVFSMEPD